MLLAERVRDVLAHPDVYADAFPVSEPPSEQEMLNHWFNQIAIEPLRGLSEEMLGAQLTPELMERTRQILVTTPFDPNSVASRVLEDANRRVYGPGLENLVSLQNGEPITNAVCTRCGRPRLCVQRRRSTLGPAVEYSAGITDPDPFVAVCGECLAAGPYNSYNRLPRGLPRWSDGGTQFTATGLHIELARQIADQYRVRFEQPAFGDGGDELAARPAHYRIRGGECACGFRTIFRGDMELHLREGNAVLREATTDAAQ